MFPVTGQGTRRYRVGMTPSTIIPLASPVCRRDMAMSERSKWRLSLGRGHGRPAPAMFRRGRERTAVREIRNLAAMVASRATAPLGIGRAGARIHDLKCDRRRVASLSGLVIGAVVLRAHELKALAAAQIVVVVAWKIRPELRVVVAVRGREIPAQRGGGGVLAEIRVGLAEGRTQTPSCVSVNLKTGVQSP